MLVRMSVTVIMSVLVVMCVIMGMTAAVLSVSVPVMMIMVMLMTVAAAGGGGALAGQEIKHAEDSQSDTAGEHQWAEEAVIRQVLGDAAALVEVEQDSAPKHEQCDAEEMHADQANEWLQEVTKAQPDQSASRQLPEQPVQWFGIGSGQDAAEVNGQRSHGCHGHAPNQMPAQTLLMCHNRVECGRWDCETPRLALEQRRRLIDQTYPRNAKSRHQGEHGHAEADDELPAEQ